MKKLIKSLLFAATAAMTFTGCNSGDPDTLPDFDAPSITWIGGDIEATHEIEDKMSVEIKATVPGGIKTFSIDIDSPALTSEILGTLGLAASMDLITPATDKMGAALKALGFPTGESVLNSTEQTFDISTLIPMIKSIYFESSNHNFKLTIKDNAGKSIVKTLKFHLTVSSSVTYNTDADLWLNSATLTAKVQHTGDVKVEYRKKGAADWQPTTLTKSDKEDGTYSALIAPEWKGGGTHATGVEQFTLDGTTGVFAGHTYEYRLLVAGQERNKGEFTTDAGQNITFSDMNTWSKYIGFDPAWVGDPEFDEYKVSYPNESIDNQFWSNGNNAFVQELCSPETLSEDPVNYAAKLKGNLAFSVVFAAGNLFSGVFEMSGAAGYARFGQKYEYTARPTALKVRVKTTITPITNVSTALTPPNDVKKGDTDPSRIFVCITDWNERHSVYSGLSATLETLNAFDPVSDTAEPAEGKVIAYGSKIFTESITDWQELIIPIIYKDKEAKPAADKYSLVISSASSAYGDYLCGSPDNEISIDYFEWVY